MTGIRARQKKKPQPIPLPHMQLLLSNQKKTENVNFIKSYFKIFNG